MAGQDAVLDAATLEWEAHMRATIVEREDAATVVDDQDRTMAAVHHEPAFRLQFIKVACENKFCVWRVHKHALVRSSINAHIGPYSANFMTEAGAS